jgi:hypothetical protein
MSNLATLQTRPPFTREEASVFGSLGGKATAEMKRAKNLAYNPSAAQTRAMQQVDKILRWMDKENDRDRYAQLTGMLDRVWNKAFPTQAAVRSRPSRRSQESLGAAPTPQPVVGTPPKPKPDSVSG